MLLVGKGIEKVVIIIKGVGKMFNIFKSRKWSGLPWFSYKTVMMRMEGTKYSDHLELTILNESTNVRNTIKVSRENADKLVEWLVNCYPRRSNVRPILRVVSVPTDTGRTETSPGATPE